MLFSGLLLLALHRDARRLQPGGVGRPASSPVASQGAPPERVRLVAGTPLTVETEHTLPMRAGEEVRGRLLYEVFAANQPVLPKGTEVTGHVVKLAPDRSRRSAARLRGDFTPFMIPAVQFDQARLPSGEMVGLATEVTTDGAAVVNLTPTPPRGGLVRQQFHQLAVMVKERLAVVTAPGKRDRLVKLLYSQLPYHPQRIEDGTSWTTETTSEVELPVLPVGEAAAETAAPAAGDSATWLLKAYLRQPLSSRTAHVGDAIRAEVAQPVRNADGTIAVPQGSALEGEVTQAKAARMFGRAGVVRFDFRSLRLPGSAQSQPVRSSIEGIAASGGQNLQLGSEGEVKPKPQDKVVVPLLLLALASRPLDRDHGDNGFGKDAVASNSLGVVGFLVGTAGGFRNVAAGIGYYGAAVSIYNRWIKRGVDTEFRRDTRVELQTSVRRSTVLKSETRGVPAR